jgi:hypothetical protein
LLKLAGASLEQRLAVDGRDIWATLTAGARSPHDAILINASPKKGAIRVGDWKLVVNGAARESFDGEDDEATNQTEVRPESPGQRSSFDDVELFNLAKDPSEERNVAADNSRRVKKLLARYNEFAVQQIPVKAHPKAKGFKSPPIWGERTPDAVP